MPPELLNGEEIVSELDISHSL